MSDIRRIFAAVLPVVCCGLTGLPAHAADSLESAVTGGQSRLDYRLRAEHVAQAPFEDDAAALTGRVRLGYATGEYRGFSAYAELESTHALGGRAYAPLDPGRPVVADPEGSETNQAWGQYAAGDGLRIRAGRQRIIYGNARFVGNVGWRQNEQTYDGLRVDFSPSARLDASYAYLGTVNRILFTSLDLDGHAANVVYEGERHSVTGYGYWVDFAATAPQRDTRTLGLRARGSWPLGGLTATYLLEYADQSDHADGPAADHAYSHARLGARFGPSQFHIARESLEGGGGLAFQTPLATLHAFNGWADQFLGTPADGLVDRYASAGTTFAGISATAVYHDFAAERGGRGYGTELDLVADWPITDNLSGTVKYADFNAGDPAFADTEKLWLMLTFSF